MTDIRKRTILKMCELVNKAIATNYYPLITEAFDLAYEFNNDHEDEEIYMSEDFEECYIMVEDDVFRFEDGTL